MYDLVGFISTIVAAVLSSEQFIHSREDLANIDFDKTTDSVVYLVRPYRANADITEATVLDTTFTIEMFFFSSNQFRNEGGDAINEYQEAIDTNNINPAGVSMKTFLTSLYNNGIYQVYIDTEITPELKKEGLVREIVRAINQVRKEKGLTRETQVTVEYQTEDEELKTVFEEFKEEIKKQVLADDLKEGEGGNKIKIDGKKLALSIK